MVNNINTNWECQIFLHQSCSTHTAQIGQFFLKHDETLKITKKGDPQRTDTNATYTETININIDSLQYGVSVPHQDQG